MIVWVFYVMSYVCECFNVCVVVLKLMMLIDKVNFGDVVMMDVGVVLSVVKVLVVDKKMKIDDLCVVEVVVDVLMWWMWMREDDLVNDFKLSFK